MTKPMKKNNRMMPACEDDFPSEIWAYSLAKKNTGMKTKLVTPSTMFSTRNGRMRKMLTCMRGDAVCISAK